MRKKYSVDCRFFEELAVYVTPELSADRGNHVYRLKVLNVRKDVCELALRSTVMTPPAVFMYGVPPGASASWEASVKNLAVKPVVEECPMDQVTKPSGLRIQIDGARVLYPGATTWLTSSDAVTLEF